MPKDIVDYVITNLNRHKIHYNPVQVIKKLVVENKITHMMTNEMKYKIFLIKMSNHKIFKNILENKDVFYDIYLSLPAKSSINIDTISNQIKNKLENRADGVFVTEHNDKICIYINLNIQYAYKNAKNYEEIATYALPYFLVYDALKTNYDFDEYGFNEVILEKREYSTDYSSYNEIIDSVKKAKTPVSIISDEILSSAYTDTVTYPEVYEIELQLDDKKTWPDAYNERQIAKTSYYCMLYSKNKYKCRIAEDYLLLKHKKAYYKFIATLKDDIKSNESIISRNLQKYIKSKSNLFKHNIKCLKQYLAAHGFYPLIYTELYVNLICCIIQKEDHTPGAFFSLFIRFDMKRFSGMYNVNTNTFEKTKDNELAVKTNDCVYTVPKIDSIYVERLEMLNEKIDKINNQVFDKDFNPLSNKILTPCVNDFDFVFSKDPRLGFSRVNTKQVGEFVLGKPLFEGYARIFGDIAKYGYFFFAPNTETLYVKQKANLDINLFINLILARTSFEYVKINSQLI